LVSVTLQGDYGKPRPALIVQADQFAELGSVVILPLTSHMIDAPLLRLTVEPSADTGLRAPSQIMVDKPMTVKADKIGPVFGRLDDSIMVSVNRLLALVLGLAN
jgi:mRNA interferase MazF